ncbi:activating transcription factor, other eukaryote [Capronia epimyces CBS 606.96]|uniref:Activating transcription factor, other eukaryote n=1 Tax=Capronia epimyces CBS 606.96 TaxID=1182542 RepID=W9YI05_9EURO|nr:activating transcription factor, other eukaryote [Capronia epimyces CBS 606.96]EXJ88861.1 activating transcription factor, other eukaryote [Capronia epimyces CBS 606.96]
MASAAVATQPSQQHLGTGPTSRTSSPMDNKKVQVNQQGTSSPLQAKSSLPEAQPPLLGEDAKPVAQVTEPLAPPPRPAPSNTAETPDYFSAVHNNGSGIGQEFNPFEQSFGVPSTETPGKTLLPPVASLTSPAIPGTSSTGGYNWQSSLRSGPLSPAMLAGPQQGDYFDSIGRGFPTPNESSLRSGLTPGGGGSMFPAPSPNSQALFNSLQSGGATPGTLDFHRTAMTAAARSKTNQFANTSNPQDPLPQSSNMDAQHDATDAANGLFMLAKGGQANNQFAVPNPAPAQPTGRNGQDQKRNRRASASGPDVDSPETHEDTKTPARGRGKKNIKSEPANNRRKTEATPKGSNKRAKGNSGVANVDPALDPHEEDDDSEDDQEQENSTRSSSISNNNSNNNGGSGNGNKKMTDEEKRRNFLERNRVAALKCRQRKKQWLANLQAKVEMYSAENDSLNTQVAQLHEEIRSLRTLLMGHKDCPVGHAQGIGQFLGGMQDPNAFSNQHVNPYGMGMPNPAAMQPGMQRT